MYTPNNLLISAMPRSARMRFVAVSELVHMSTDFVLWKPDEQSTLAFFPVSGYISIEAVTKGVPALEVGMIGREGMAGLHLFLGATSSSLGACVRMEGSAYVCNATELRLLMLECLPFRVSMGHYIALTLAQLSASVACGRFHSTRQRLAKWLLMAADRVGGGVLHATQSTIASLLGVRRVGVTIAATEMQDAGYIRYARGEIEVLNRHGLEGCACSCYSRESGWK